MADNTMKKLDNELLGNVSGGAGQTGLVCSYCGAVLSYNGRLSSGECYMCNSCGKSYSYEQGRLAPDDFFTAEGEFRKRDHPDRKVDINVFDTWEILPTID